MFKQKYLFLLFVLPFFLSGTAPEPTYQFAVLKYSGGGDWYSDPSAVPNLISFCNEELNMNIDPEPATVEVGSRDLFNYPFLHMTGHGNVVFDRQEAENLRRYLKGGGFLHIDDNYGMDEYVRSQMEKIFPDKELIELPFGHPIYHQRYDLENGPPKIHEHEGERPQGLAYLHEGRVVLYYTYESDISDGWEDPEVHDNPQELREKALRMGANIVQYVMMSDDDEIGDLSTD